MTQRQHDLFDSLPAPWELDDARQVRVASVVFSSGPPQTFDYRVPPELIDDVESGRRVRVPLGRGNRIATAYCVAVEYRQEAGRRLKDVAGVLDSQRLLTPALIELTRWMADYYLCGWGQVLECVLPAGVRSQAGTRRMTFVTLADDFDTLATAHRITSKQQEVLDLLAAAPQGMQLADLAEAAECTQAPINALRKKGLIVASQRRVRHGVQGEASTEREESLELNDDQQQALQAIEKALDARRHRTVLMHGVTGSGKTEVYIQAIHRVLAAGRQAIVLVPEISLTPQTKGRFMLRFGEVAVLHSHLSDAERSYHWERIARGEVSVVVGARSAVFAPTPQLGLIVMDEEHETSFKQDSAPRYHARDVALHRAEMEDIPLVLGSATPSLESFVRAKRGEYQLLDMPRRVLDRPMPGVATIDLRNEVQDRRERGVAISRPLRMAMNQALRADEQVILLLNRRGFSTHIQCPGCGHVVRCPSCEIALTHHRDEKIALCHYCDYHVPPPLKCPDCSFQGIRYSGMGTQRLEAEVRAAFPEDECLRMDRDAMQRHGSHEKALAAFRSGEVRILLGTQMIAKGLDFPNVTLVGVINADMALHLPDFRAAERAFQLLVQVAGRTGRGEKGGRVLVQTFSPEHPAIAAAVQHDYARFASGECPIRELLSYPPYSSLVRFVVRGQSEVHVRGFAEQLVEHLKSEIEGERDCRIMGPAPCPLPKLRGNFRFHLQMQGPRGDRIRQAARCAVTELKPPEGVQWIADVDPVDML